MYNFIILYKDIFQSIDPIQTKVVAPSQESAIMILEEDLGFIQILDIKQENP